MNEFANLIKSVGLKPIKKEKNEGILRNSLFVFAWGSIFIKIINHVPLFRQIVSYVDDMLVYLFGESDLLVIAQKK